MRKLENRYVWEFPVRATHWVNMFSIVILSATGLFIGSATTIAHSTSDYTMGWVRVVHFTTGYIFATSVVSRIYWSFVGNRYASWREFVPFVTADGRRRMVETLRYYLFIDRTPPHVVGHNALAGATYLLVFGLYLLMVLTGFALYGQYAPGGIINKLTGWLFLIVSNQKARLVHHLTMWLLIGFAIHHVYSAWLMDVKEKGGVISSIFGGYKGIRMKG